LPDSPAAAAFTRFLKVLNQGDRGSLQAYVNEAFGAKGREKMPADKRLQWLEGVYAASGGYDYQFPAPDEGNHDHRFIAVARNRKSGEWEKVGVEVEPDPPHKLVHAQRRLTALGKLAADVKFTDTMARTVPLRDLRGKFVVLDFWASWCEPCLTLMPELQRLHKDYSDRGVRVIGVNIWEDKAPTHRDPEEFMAVQNYEFELMFLDDAAVPALDVRSLPQMSVLDAEGRYIFITRGSSPGKADLTDLRAALDRELAKSAPSVGQE
jgi:thiol-disulfide isomerase/thioredoxin